MSSAYPYIDILRDALRPFSNNSYLILTDHGIPIRIYPAAVDGAGIPDFQIYSTSKKTCKELGSTDPWMPQSPEGYMCHGYTKYPVKVPYVGQLIFFWIPKLQSQFFTTHSVRRIYSKPVSKLLSDPWKHLRQVIGSLSESGNPFASAELLLLGSTRDSYNEFLDKPLQDRC
ncbi:MAG: hypothetical protein UW80_C0024G0003 [Microgenomates group bacterium GW2011_GWC1_44_9]|nr:MAG: hypothetical protein UW80_C0024G0003 [Microgenomates group bacterium GW2011_GWC1_44_9]